jgi:hypothetical protein
MLGIYLRSSKHGGGKLFPMPQKLPKGSRTVTDEVGPVKMEVTEEVAQSRRK